MRIDLFKYLEENYPRHEFKLEVGDNVDELYIDGIHFPGFAAFRKDVNSYYAGNSFEIFIECIEWHLEQFPLIYTKAKAIVEELEKTSQDNTNNKTCFSNSVD